MIRIIVNHGSSDLSVNSHILYDFDTYTKTAYCLLTAQVSIGRECWSSANGVASGGCASGTQCGPWLPDGGTWDGSSPWYCLASPKLASGATCDYATKVSKSNEYLRNYQY